MGIVQETRQWSLSISILSSYAISMLVVVGIPRENSLMLFFVVSIFLSSMIWIACVIILMVASYFRRR